jgi:hypothetical protein
VEETFHVHVRGVLTAGLPVLVVCVASDERADAIRSALDLTAPVLPTGNTVLDVLASRLVA